MLDQFWCWETFWTSLRDEDQRCVAQKLERSSALHRKMSLHILHDVPSCTSCKSAKPVTRLQDGVECLQLILAPFPENIEGIVRLDLAR